MVGRFVPAIAGKADPVHHGMRPDYFGQPRLPMFSAAALWLSVTDAGSCPPLGMNHTSTRRIALASDEPALTEDAQKPVSKLTPFWFTPGELTCI